MWISCECPLVLGSVYHQTKQCLQTKQNKGHCHLMSFGFQVCMCKCTMYVLCMYHISYTRLFFTFWGLHNTKKGALFKFPQKKLQVGDLARILMQPNMPRCEKRRKKPGVDEERFGPQI